LQLDNLGSLSDIGIALNQSDTLLVWQWQKTPKGIVLRRLTDRAVAHDSHLRIDLANSP